MRKSSICLQTMYYRCSVNMEQSEAGHSVFTETKMTIWRNPGALRSFETKSVKSILSGHEFKSTTLNLRYSLLCLDYCCSTDKKPAGHRQNSAQTAAWQLRFLTPTFWGFSAVADHKSTWYSSSDLETKCQNFVCVKASNVSSNTWYLASGVQVNCIRMKSLKKSHSLKCSQWDIISCQWNMQQLHQTLLFATCSSSMLYILLHLKFVHMTKTD